MVTNPSVIRGAFLQNEARQAVVGRLSGRPGKLAIGAQATLGSKKALIIKVFKEKKGSLRNKSHWRWVRMPVFVLGAPPCPGSPVPPRGGGKGLQPHSQLALHREAAVLMAAGCRAWVGATDQPW